MDRESWVEAVKWWKAVINLQSGAEAGPWIRLSRAYRKQGKSNQADSAIKQGIKKHPRHYGLNIEFAEQALDREDWVEAVSRLQNIVSWLEPGASSELIEDLYRARFNLSLAKRLANIKDYKKQIKNYRLAKEKKGQPKIAVYTAIAGNYDSLKLPEKLDPRFDYIAFTDTPLIDSGIFSVRPLPYIDADKTRSARFAKTHPHMLLQDYDIAIWIDANIMITGDMHPLVDDFISSGKPVAAIPHPIRKSIFEELEACIARGKDENQIMSDQVGKYKQLGFSGEGLIESNFMIFDLKEDRVKNMLNCWWSEIDKHSRRDQLSLPFAINKAGIDWHPITNPPNSIRSHPSFILIPHTADDSTLKLLYSKLTTDTINPFAGTSYSTEREKRIQSQTNRKVDVIYCVHNALEDVMLCLGSVVRHRKNKNLRLIIIDDGSDTPATNYLKKFADSHKTWVKLLRNKTATGYTKAANKGLRASTGEFVILLNSDTIVTDGWTEKMAEAVFSTPGAGIVGPLSSAASHQSIPNIKSGANQTAVNKLPPGLLPDDINNYCEHWAVSGLYPVVPLIHGFCFGVTRETIKKVGYFDEESFPYGYGEENDYCFRAVDAGFSLVIATNTYIYHAKSKSYPSTRREKLMEAGNWKLRELRGKERIRRAIISMQNNPLLIRVRDKAKRFYG